jgi:hypothetical protein
MFQTTKLFYLNNLKFKNQQVQDRAISNTRLVKIHRIQKKKNGLKKQTQ